VPAGSDSGAVSANRDYYERLTRGREDYWHKMAAPRLRLGVLLRLLAERPPGRLVDLGCGNGALLREMGRRFPAAELCGLDLSRPQVEANRRALPELRFEVVDLERSLPDDAGLCGAFDAVVSCEIVEHLDDPEALLRNALALARPGVGRLLLSTQSGPLRETERRVGHQRHFERRGMEALLRSAGWEVVRVWNQGFPFHDLSKWAANLDPDASMRRFGERAYGPLENLLCLALRGAFLLNSRRRGAQLFAVARRPA
jgi:2-polyprenyl-3-methyl-5-hydroxy-6-metoxy-1,4-benzoquinol methylase